jgi:hypothetical protein
VGGGIGGEPRERLGALALGADRAPAAVLVGVDDGVDEALEEVALRGFAAPPGGLERLVRAEVVARPGEQNPSPEGRLDVIVAVGHGQDPAAGG